MSYFDGFGDRLVRDGRVLGVVTVVGWLALAGVLQQLLGLLTPETYVSVSLAGFYAIYEYANPRYVSDAWRRRFDWTLAFVTVLYVGYVVYRVVSLLPEGARLM